MRRYRRKSWSSLWADTVLLGVEAQMVMGLRLAKLAWAKRGRKAEQRLMIREKAKAAGDAQLAIAKSIMTGAGDSAHSKVVKLYRRRVRSNLRRLGRGG
jgi:hypothetical protein